MHEGARPRTSVSAELCVATSKYLSTQLLTTWDRGIRYFLGLRVFIIRRPDYLDAPYRKFLGLRYSTTRVPGRRDLDTQILGRTRSSWSALIYYVNTRLHGRTRNC